MAVGTAVGLGVGKGVEIGNGVEGIVEPKPLFPPGILRLSFSQPKIKTNKNKAVKTEIGRKFIGTPCFVLRERVPIP